MRLYHVTTAVAADSIEASGFRDRTATYMSGELFTGVWLSNVPADVGYGAKADCTDQDGALYEIDMNVPSAVLDLYEWVPEGGSSFREWLVPASMINDQSVVRRVPPRRSVESFRVRRPVTEVTTMPTKRRGHHEGSIRERADGTWEARISLPGGKRRSFYGKTRKEAQDALRTALRDVDAGVDLGTGRQTVAQYLAKWLEASVRPSVRVRTAEGYESIVRVRVVPRLGRIQLTRLTPLDLQGLYAALEAGGLSRRSVQHTHRCLHRAFDQAVRWRMLSRNPCDGTTPPQAARTEMRVLSQDQVDTLIASTRDHPAHALYVLAVTTGMRAGELMGLKWGDVDLAGSALFVRRALQRQNAGGLVFVEPKTGRSRRRIVLSRVAIAALRLHRKAQLERRLFYGEDWQDLDLVFCGADGRPADPSWQRQVFYTAMEAAGLPAMRFHDLRHTAATLLLSKGVHPKVVSEMLGHATITLTLDTYSHLLPAMHGEAAATMDAMFGVSDAS